MPVRKFLHPLIKRVPGVAALARILHAYRSFLDYKSEVHPPTYVGHGDWPRYLSDRFNKPGMSVLEIGSRVVTGSNFRTMFDQAEYLGFDFYAGENVDIVGDAHKLASHFPPDKKFDLIFSHAVFEHLHMPWIVAGEIQKLLKVGGYVFVETHFSFSTHERPWNFFQFSDMGLRALFNEALGFDVEDIGMSNPIIGWFGPNSDPYLRYQMVGELYCHSEILCRKRCDVSSFNWEKVGMDEIVGGTRYPAPRA